jgi:hypothetical protein
MARKKRKRDDLTIVSMTPQNLEHMPIDLFDELKENVTAFANVWSVRGPLNIAVIIPDLVWIAPGKKHRVRLEFDEAVTVEDVIESVELVAQALERIAYLARSIPEFVSALQRAANRMRERLPRQLPLRIPNDGILLLRKAFLDAIEPIMTAMNNVIAAPRPVKRAKR